MTEAVHTSAPPAADEPDMFGDVAPPAAPAAPMLEFTGVLMHDAEVRIKQVGGHGRHLPVLCLDIEPVSRAGHTLHAEQVYTEATRHLADERAAALRKGTRITLTTPLEGARVLLPHIQWVDIKA